jgi:hypothetical protein
MAYSNVAPQGISEMAIARSKLVDVSVARWYHCVSRCVRMAFVLGGDGNRNEWLENRLVGVGIVRPYGDHQIKDEWGQRWGALRPAPGGGRR